MNMALFFSWISGTRPINSSTRVQLPYRGHLPPPPQASVFSRQMGTKCRWFAPTGSDCMERWRHSDRVARESQTEVSCCEGYGTPVQACTGGKYCLFIMMNCIYRWFRGDCCIIALESNHTLKHNFAEPLANPQVLDNIVCVCVVLWVIILGPTFLCR